MVDGDPSYNVSGIVVHNSGAGSLVNYALEITKIDPLKYDLLFERFLNPDRGHMPDIDSDFCEERGPEVFEYLSRKYGKEKFANIIAFSMLQPKAVFKDVCRVFDIPIALVNHISKFIPAKVDKFEELLSVSEVKEFFDKYPDIYKHCEKLYGTPRHASQHAAGCIILPFPVTDLMPTQNATPIAKTGYVPQLAQLSKEEVEEIGAVKDDILKLAEATRLQKCVQMVNELYDANLDLDNVDLDDKETWDLICKLDLTGVFQMDKGAGADVIAKIQPRNIEELSLVNAFIRPGTSGLDEYCAAKKDPSKVRKFAPVFDEILKVSNGGITYQEQTMQLISCMMGISFGKADIYRRALEKPKKKGNVELVKEFEEQCVERGVERGIDRAACEAIKKEIMDNCAYLFNKSHSITYSYISFYTAYMKAHYPLVFYCVMMNYEDGAKLQDCVFEAKKHGIKILPPSISLSSFNQTVEDKEQNSIRMGLSSVKGLGEHFIEEVIANRPYNNIQEYLDKAGKATNRSGVMTAIKIGLFVELPLIVPSNTIKEETGELRIEPYDDEHVYVYMNRSQQMKWAEQFFSLKAEASIPNYLINADNIKGKYLDAFEDLVYEKGTNNLVIPAVFLAAFGVDADDKLKTRAKPKGILKTMLEDYKSIPLSVKAFMDVYNYIVLLQDNATQLYMDELSQFEISFSPHPLEALNLPIPILSQIPDGKMVRTAGIIVSIEDRFTKNNKPFKTIFIQTPQERQKLTVWGNIFRNYENVLYVGSMIQAIGRTGYGGITVEEIKHVPKYSAAKPEE